MQEARLYTDFNQINNLRADAHNNPNVALKEVAQQFEAIFTHMVLKSMRQANEAMSSDLLDQGQINFYQNMYDEQLSLNVSNGNGIKLSDLIVKQLSQEG